VRNIINQEELPQFLEKLKRRHPWQAGFIQCQVRSYILKKENTFLMRDENLGLSLKIKCFLKSATPPEEKMFNNQGIWGSYLKLNLSDACFDKYSRLLDFASDISKSKLNHTSFDDLLVKYRNRPAKKRLKIASLIQGRDFKYITNINSYFVIELLTAEAFFKEGQSMRNCLGTSNVMPRPNKKMFSLRNYKNKPIMTIHVDSIRKSVMEAKGIANSAPDQEILSLVSKNLGLKQCHHRVAETDSSIVIEIIGQIVILCLLGLPSLLVFYLAMGIVFR
jgi:hypothetical protein